MKLLIADAIDREAIALLEAAGIGVVFKPGLSAAQLTAEIPHYEALAVRSQTKVTREVIEAGANLKLIVRAGIGLDTIDVAAALQYHIEVRNTPNATVASVAEHTLGLLLALMRFIPQAHAKLMNGIWDKKSFQGQELAGKTLGIVGFGKIGRAVAERAQAFEMKTIAHDPYLDDDIAKRFTTPLVPLPLLLAEANIVTLHLPLLPETAGLLTAQQIAAMKPGSFLINCARGGIVDEAAVADALKSGHLAGAAFDVFAEEPLTASPLMGLPNAILTPHLGATTEEGQKRAAQELAQIVIEFFKTRS